MSNLEDIEDVSLRQNLSKRFLTTHTILGRLASCHLDKVIDRDKKLIRPLVDAYNTYIFNAHDVIIGDFNTEWAHMIGADVALNGVFNKKKPTSKAAWMRDTELASVSWPSYLPGCVLSADELPAKPPNFDQVLYRVSKAIVAIPCNEPHAPPTDRKHQIQRDFRAHLPNGSRHPRSTMADIRWPSDHTWVIAILRGRHAKLKVATWNTADPVYFSQFHPDAARGFGWQPEQARLASILYNIRRVFNNDVDIIGLQEVPAAILYDVVALATEFNAHTDWVAAPSTEDRDNYEPHVGRRGSSAALAALSEAERAAALAPVPHEVLITRFRAMKDGDPRKPV